MSKISVVMPTYNAGSYVSEAIESVLQQSFDDFEFIIIDDGSEDDTLSVIRSYTDKRIRLIENHHDFIGSLNLGLQVSSGKYIARMDADDRMHTDRLRIQHAVMEEEQDITICSSWMSFFGEKVSGNIVSSVGSGILDFPLLQFLKTNIIIHPSVMMRTDFLRLHSLQYESYDCGEDYKLWVEVAKLGGVFYIEPQYLLYYRVSDEQVSNRKSDSQLETSNRIRREVLDYLIKSNHDTYPSLVEILTSLEHTKKENLLNEEEVLNFFFGLFRKNKNSLVLGFNKEIINP